MSTVTATQMQCDTLTAKNGEGIPTNLKDLTLAAFAEYRADGGIVMNDTFNISSIITTTTGAQTITMINPMSGIKYPVCANSVVEGSPAPVRTNSINTTQIEILTSSTKDNEVLVNAVSVSVIIAGTR